MKTFKYTIEDIKKELFDGVYLNALGVHGWELIQMNEYTQRVLTNGNISFSERVKCIFKREIIKPKSGF